jgi:hypothetical protein
MLNNHLRTAYRQLARHRSYTIINIAGPAAGIAVALLIFVYIRFETSYDDFHSSSIFSTFPGWKAIRPMHLQIPIPLC